jgi:hypothetical protein
MGVLSIVFKSISYGLGDDWFAARMQRVSDGYWYCFTGASAGTFQASPPTSERNIPLEELDDIGNQLYGYDLTSALDVLALVYVHDLHAYGEPVRGLRYVNLVDGVDTPASGVVDLNGPPYLVEAGRVFGDQNLRGSLASLSRKVFEGNVLAHESATFLMRVLNSGGNAVGVSAFTSVVASVYLVNDDDPSVRELVVSHIVDLGDAYLGGLLDDYQWQGMDPPNADLKGYNFRWSLPTVEDPFPYPESRYLVEFVFTPVSGEPVAGKFLVWARQ